MWIILLSNSAHMMMLTCFVYKVAPRTASKITAKVAIFPIKSTKFVIKSYIHHFEA